MRAIFMTAFTISLLTAFSVVSLASEAYIVRNPHGGGPPNLPARDDIVWQQLPNYTIGMNSQDDLSDDLQDSEVIDDFELEANTVIIRLGWSGTTWIDDQHPEWFIVTIYVAPADCVGPDDDALIVSEQLIYEYDFSPAPWGYDYSAAIEAVELAAGIYWISIRGAVNPSGPGNVYSWTASDEEWNCNAMIRHEGWGSPEFLPVSVWFPDLRTFSLTLYSEPAVATEAATWTAVKSSYR